MLAANVPLKLPEARAGSSRATVRLEVLQPGPRPPVALMWAPIPAVPGAWRADGPDGSYLRLAYEGSDTWAEFVLDGTGSRLWMSLAGDVALDEAVELLLGPVSSALLWQRGATCLHAAVVQLAGRTVALVGDKGAGKSSTALAIVRMGGRLVADDVAAVTEEDGRFIVAPAQARLRLRPDVAASLFGVAEALPAVWAQDAPRPDKRYADVEATGVPAALDAVVLLEPRGDRGLRPTLRRLTPADALARLVVARHVAQLLDAAQHRHSFSALGRLVARVPVHGLVRPEGLDSLDAIADVLRRGVLVGD